MSSKISISMRDDGFDVEDSRRTTGEGTVIAGK